ncbi:MAG: PDZ/DHR/GLGF domain-containing protein [Thermoanaerobacterales bacterium 50_218]|nr:MAG: PDZ/DHR/GLGF domain-containing protein [Thermoanaerobacterales bacterium 50_218]HAA90167.1 PDZ domain-containing protein [Peptococcaceae bacterium]
MGFPWAKVLPLVGRSFLGVLTSPFFWLVVILIWLQYQKMQKSKEALFGVRHPVFPVVAAAIGYGIIGGLVGSLLMVFFGVSISGLGIGYLWLLAIFLMLINPRFLCFSYAGGILALFSLITGHPKVDIPSLMGLVAILHLVESVLILISGHIDPLPVYVRNYFGQVVGGFNLQKFWPIPLAVMATFVNLPPEAGGEIIRMPDWWPLIRPWGEWGSAEVIYGIFPVVAALGYGEVALTRLPREKTRHSALNLSVFSLILLGLAVVASHFPQLAVLPALFSPLGHEAVIYIGRNSELKGPSRFVAPGRGVMVLDVIRGSPADRVRLRPGDVILSIDHFSVNSRVELAQVLALAGSSFELEYVSGQTHLVRLQVYRRSGEPLGVIPVPDPGDPANVDYASGSLLKKLWQRIRR